MKPADTISNPADAGAVAPSRDARRAFLLAALLQMAPMTASRAAPAGRPRVLAGYLGGVIEPGGSIERRVIDMLSPMAAADIHWMPWARALLTAAEGNCLLFPLARTPEREASWQWLAPLARDRIVLVLPPGLAHRGQQLADLRRLRTGAVRSAFLVARLTALGFQHVDVAPAELANARKLALGRIEAWATVASVAAAMGANGHLPAGVQIVPLEHNPFTMWLAASSDLNTERLVQAPRPARGRSAPLPVAFDTRT